MPRNLETRRFSAQRFGDHKYDLVPTNTILCLKITIWCLGDFVPGILCLTERFCAHKYNLVPRIFCAWALVV